MMINYFNIISYYNDYLQYNIISMKKQNFHYNRMPIQSAQSNKNLVDELIKIDITLEQQKRKLQQKKREQQNLRAEFYQIPKKNYKNTNQEQNLNFFDKFERPKQQEIFKKQKYKKQLQEQIQQKKKTISVERNRKQQLADDIMNDLLQNKPKFIPTYQPSQNKNINQIKKIQKQIIYQPKKQERMILNKKIPQQQIVQQTNFFIRGSQQQQKIKKQQQLKQHQDTLHKQMEEQKQRKLQRKKQKLLYSNNNIESIPAVADFKKKQQEGSISLASKNEQRNNNKNQSKNQQINKPYNQKQSKFSELFNKYKRGLIDLQQYQSSKRKLQNYYGPISNPKPQKQQIKQQIHQTSNHQNQKQSNIYQNQSKNIQQSYQNNKIPSLILQNQSNNTTSQYIPPNLSTNLNFGLTQPLSQQYLQQQINYANMINAQMNPNQLTFQLEFMKKMFEEMKQLLKTNMMSEHQRLQQTYLRAGTMPQFNFHPSTQAFMQNNQIPTQLPVQTQIPIQNTITTQIPIQTAVQTSTLIPNLKLPISNIKNINNISQRGDHHYNQLSSQNHNILNNYDNLASNMYDQSLQVQNLKIPYITSQRDVFFKKKYKVEKFKAFDFTEDYNRKNIQIPSTSIYYNIPDGKKKLKKQFDADLAYYKKLAVQKQVQIIKQKKKFQNQKYSKDMKEKQLQQQKQQQQLKQRSKKKEKVIKNEQKMSFKNNVENQKKHKQNGQKEEYKQIKVKKQQKQEQLDLKVESNPKKSYYESQFQESIQQQFHLKKPPQLKNDQLKQIRKQLFMNPLTLINGPKINQQLQSYKSPKNNIMEIQKYQTTKKINQSQNQACQSYYQQSIKLKQYKPQIRSRQLEKQKTVQSIEEDQPLFKKQQSILKNSRAKYKQTKKIKQNVLTNFKHNPINLKSQIKQLSKEPQHYYQINNTFEADIKQEIYYKRQNTQQHQESQTLLSKYEQSQPKVIVIPALPPKSRKNIDQESSEVSKQVSNLTSLKQARQKAKQVKNKEKKQSQISIQLIQQLQKGIKRKDVGQKSKQIVNSKVESVNKSKQLLSMLDDMVDQNQNQNQKDDLSQYYPNDFESYRSKTKDYKSNTKFNI